jgi:hypothetical protein
MTVANTFPTPTTPVSYANPATSVPIVKGSPGVSSYVNNHGQAYHYHCICEYCKRLAIVQPIAMITSTHPVMRVTLSLVRVVVLIHHLPMPFYPNFSLMMVCCDTLSTALVASTLVNNDLWIADSRASCHMTCSNDGMFDCHLIND